MTTQNTNETQQSFSLTEQGDAIFETRLASAIRHQNHATRGENIDALKSGFTGLFVIFKSMEEADQLDAFADAPNRVYNIFTHAGQKQDDSITSVFINTLIGAVQDPQAGAYAIQELQKLEEQRQRDAQLQAIHVLLNNSDISFGVPLVTQAPSIVFNDKKVDVHHTHHHAHDPKANRNFRRFMRTGIAASVLGICFVAFQNNKNGEALQVNNSKAIERDSIAMVQMKDIKNIIVTGDSLINEKLKHNHDDMWNIFAKTRRTMKNMSDAIDTLNTNRLKAQGDSLSL